MSITSYILKLEPVTSRDKEKLWPIVSDPDVMRYVADGKPWTRAKLDRFINYSVKDWKDPSRADWLAWKILDLNEPVDNQFAGVISWHPFQGAGHRLFLTYFLSPGHRGRGIGSTAIEQSLQYLAKIKPGLGRVYSLTLQDNIAAIKSLAKAGFVKSATPRIHGKQYFLWTRDVNSPT